MKRTLIGLAGLALLLPLLTVLATPADALTCIHPHHKWIVEQKAWPYNNFGWVTMDTEVCWGSAGNLRSSSASADSDETANGIVLGANLSTGNPSRVTNMTSIQAWKTHGWIKWCLPQKSFICSGTSDFDVHFRAIAPAVAGGKPVIDWWADCYDCGGTNGRTPIKISNG